jgi:hypothetical protein
LRSKSAIEQEIDRRAKVYADGAKATGMTNYEFCKEILEGMGAKFKPREGEGKPVGKILNSLLEKVVKPDNSSTH